MNAKRIFLLLVLFLWTSLFGACQTLHDADGRPTKELLAVLKAFNISHDGTWESIQKETEKAWLSHGRSSERWEIETIQDHSPEKTYSLFTFLGMTQTIFADKHCYTYGVVLGATLQVVRERFWFLKEAWEKGVRFSSLVLLTGDRPLDPIFENEKNLIDSESSPYPFRRGWCFEGVLPKNETEMMELVFDQLDLPHEWREMPIVVVDTPKPTGLKRPHTEHTLFHWMAMNPCPGSVVFVSNQPFICRQNALLRTYLPVAFEMETVGNTCMFDQFRQEKRATAIFLAELAYWIKINYATSA